MADLKLPEFLAYLS